MRFSCLDLKGFSKDNHLELCTNGDDKAFSFSFSVFLSSFHFFFFFFDAVVSQGAPWKRVITVILLNLVQLL